MQGRSSRPIFFIDTAMPRDVEPAVARMENVFLYDLDDLARIAAENRTARQAEIVKCEALLAERATALWTQVERQLAPPAPAGAPAAGEAFGAACPA
jgi:glutamyl-tRNA reductase